MRLTDRQAELIRQCAEATYGEDAMVLLFGSRTDDSRKGGDIDLLLRVPEAVRTLQNKLHFLVRLQRVLGERRIDAVYEEPENDFVRNIRQKAVIL